MEKICSDLLLEKRKLDAIHSSLFDPPVQGLGVVNTVIRGIEQKVNQVINEKIIYRMAR
jgi:hypothetical protein